LPYILSDNDADALKTKTGREKAKQPTDWDNEQHAGILERMFTKEPQMISKDFIKAITKAYGVGVNKAQNFVSYFKEESLIKWQGKGSSIIYSIV
jgi:ribosomal protein S19E (S16A)